MNENDDEKIEFTKRGKRQLQSIVYKELKEQIDTLIEPMIKKSIENRIDVKLTNFLSNSRIERLVKDRIDHNYWMHFNKMLEKADFQKKLTDEIIQYLHKRWACGTTPFEQQFDEALMKAVKQLIGGRK